MKSGGWTAAELPRQDGKTFVITGANSGLGFEAARVLAGLGARVVLACRNSGKAADAAARIAAETPGAVTPFIPLDLARLASVRDFAARASDELDRIDCLVNNAGLMGLPYGKTEDGFEQTFGINHLGHFALTGLLGPKLLAAGTATEPARVVATSSIAHRQGRIRFEDIHWDRGYWTWGSYAMSKLANLMFAYELDRRLERSGEPVIALACHPGVADTNIVETSTRSRGLGFLDPIMKAGSRLVTQPAWKGALPTLWAAARPDARRGSYIGPRGPFGAFGLPTETGSTRRSRDEDAARRLWEVSVELTGVDPFA
ncbi:MAG: SDR family NAD(P)-dependent oxidoreductase [Myxococcales bacterium]|nr:SDR family NAD(P)-dependent oxidoreductase [Myxococcales bacterium]MCB9530203.1 SDR family NAD(P)-dependent oxidoreductase [Myxococcales bacterium]MCB9533716.1 SDR family NAD(P)-dependent oxidoreductase [Myxococcales bacterium]